MCNFFRYQIFNTAAQMKKYKKTYTQNHYNTPKMKKKTFNKNTLYILLPYISNNFTQKNLQNMDHKLNLQQSTVCSVKSIPKPWLQWLWHFACLGPWLLAIVTYDRWHEKPDIWQLRHDTWNVVPETWHFAHDTWFIKKKTKKKLFFIGATICTRQEIQCLVYAGFFPSTVFT